MVNDYIKLLISSVALLLLTIALSFSVKTFEFEFLLSTLLFAGTGYLLGSRLNLSASILFCIISAPFVIFRMSHFPEDFNEPRLIYVVSILISLTVLFFSVLLGNAKRKNRFFREILITLLVFFALFLIPSFQCSNQFVYTGFVYFVAGYLLTSRNVKQDAMFLIMATLPFFLTYGLGIIGSETYHVIFNLLIAPIGFCFGHIAKKSAITASRPVFYFSLSGLLFLLMLGRIIVVPNWISFVKTTSITAGNSIPDLGFYSLDSIRLDSKVFENKVVVLDFWTTACGRCFEEFSAMEQFYQTHKSNENMSVYLVNLPIPNDNPTRIGNAIDKQILEKGFEVPVLLAEGNYYYYSRIFGFKGVPAVAVVDKKGTIRYCGPLYTSNTIFINNLTKITSDLLK